jgi:hypothetical protein
LHLTASIRLVGPNVIWGFGVLGVEAEKETGSLSSRRGSL